MRKTPEEVLRVVANLAAQRDFSRSIEFKDTLLACIAAEVQLVGYGDEVDVL